MSGGFGGRESVNLQLGLELHSAPDVIIWQRKPFHYHAILPRLQDPENLNL